MQLQDGVTVQPSTRKYIWVLHPLLCMEYGVEKVPSTDFQFVI